MNDSERIRTNLIVVLLGIVTLILGIYQVKSTYVYIFTLFGYHLSLSQKSISFFTIFNGFFLIIFGYLSSSKTKLSWRIMVVLLPLTLFIILINFPRQHYYFALDFVLGAYALWRLISSRKRYVFPSSTLGRPEIIVAFITIIFTVSYGVGGSLLLGNQFKPVINNIGTALYFTGETVTTLGFGDILPVTLTSRMFTISLSVLGIAIFFGSMAILITPIIERRVGGVATKMEKRQLMSLDSYILVLGYSDWISEFITAKRKDGKVVVILDNRVQEKSALEEIGFIVLAENADDESTLASFNLSRSSLIIIGSPDDGYNLLISAALAQQKDQESFSDRVIILVNKSKDVKKFNVFGYKVMDISLTIGAHLDSRFNQIKHN